MEYPGYGVYIGKPSQEQILIDAEILFDYLQYYIGIPTENIIVFGRSLGSGPATFLASRRNPGALLLMSPFTSLKDVARGVAGKLGSLLIPDQFRNIDEISSVLCPTFFVHGKGDSLVSYKHTVSLSEKVAGNCMVHLPETMTHNRYFMDRHIIFPIQNFLTECQYEINIGEEVYELPKKLYMQPESLKGKKNERSLAAKIINRS